MNNKLLLLALLFAVCAGFQFAVDVIQPALDAQIAVMQFEDSDAPMTLIRALSGLEANIPSINLVIFVTGALLIFRRDIVKLFHQLPGEQ